ncbi:hypothetical protein [Neptunomonas sp.]|uniref:hypothetical protein n=1 Tax=Neptunomonas sp. TaxID=1971898 RepID=UPI003564C9BA
MSKSVIEPSVSGKVSIKSFYKEEKTEMDLGNIIALLGVWTALVAAIVGFASHKLNVSAAKFAMESQRNALFLSLRDRYLATRLQIPARVYSKNLIIHDTDPAWPLIQHYWYNTFDEWYATNKLNDGKFLDLWCSYFGPATQSTLQFPAMVDVLESMLNGAVSFGSERDSFENAIRALYEKLPATERAPSHILNNANQ